MLWLGRLFLGAAALCFVIGLFTYSWSGALAQIESVQVKSKPRSDFIASRAASNGGRAVQGQVIDLRLYQYRYSVDSVAFSGWGTTPQTSVIRQASDEIRHQPLKVYYWREFPSVSVTKRGVALWPFLGLFSIGILTWAIGNRYR